MFESSNIVSLFWGFVLAKPLAEANEFFLWGLPIHGHPANWRVSDFVR